MQLKCIFKKEKSFEGSFTLLPTCINYLTNNQESNTYSKNDVGRSLRSSINFQNGPTKLIPNEEKRSRAQRYSQDINNYDNSEIVYSCKPGRVQLSNQNENYNPYSKGVCSKKAPFLKINPKLKSVGSGIMKTLVLDIDETLVHASFKPIPNADTIVSVGKDKIHVKFRPGAEEFIEHMSKFYELIVFTASMDRYAFPLMEKLDKHHLCEYVLCREYCTQMNGAFVKDLSKMGRNLEDIIILDNSPNSYFFQRNNGLPIISWYDDQLDRELYKYIEILEVLANVTDVTHYIPKICDGDEIDYFKAYQLINDLKCNALEKDFKKHQSERSLKPSDQSCKELSNNINIYNYGYTFDSKINETLKQNLIDPECKEYHNRQSKPLKIDVKDKKIKVIYTNY